MQDSPRGKFRDERRGFGGIYRLNGKSLLFVEGKLKVPRIAVILNGEFQKFEGANVSITDCLNKKFNYQELMDAK